MTRSRLAVQRVPARQLLSRRQVSHMHRVPPWHVPEQIWCQGLHAVRQGHLSGHQGSSQVQGVPGGHLQPDRWSCVAVGLQVRGAEQLLAQPSFIECLRLDYSMQPSRKSNSSLVMW